MRLIGLDDKQYRALHRYVSTKGTEKSRHGTFLYLNAVAKLCASDNYLTLELLYPRHNTWKECGDTGPWTADVQQLADMAIAEEEEHYQAAKNRYLPTPETGRKMEIE